MRSTMDRPRAIASAASLMYVQLPQFSSAPRELAQNALYALFFFVRDIGVNYHVMTECVLLLVENVFSYQYRMCSLTSIECVLLLNNVFSYMPSLQNVSSYERKCSPADGRDSSILARQHRRCHSRRALHVYNVSLENTFYPKRTHSILREHVLS